MQPGVPQVLEVRGVRTAERTVHPLPGVTRTSEWACEPLPGGSTLTLLSKLHLLGRGRGSLYHCLGLKQSSLCTLSLLVKDAVTFFSYADS